MNWTLPGSITVNFTVDENSPLSHSYSPTLNRPARPFTSSPYYLLFNSSELFPGNHSLKINVVDILGDQPLIIDFLTYKPSFSSLKDKPNFAAFDGGNSDGLSSPSASTSTSDPTVSHGPTNNGNDSVNARIGSIIGGVVGGLVFGVLIVILWRFLRKKTKLFQRHTGITPYTLKNANSHPTSSLPERDPERSYSVPFSQKRSSQRRTVKVESKMTASASAAELTNDQTHRMRQHEDLVGTIPRDNEHQPFATGVEEPPPPSYHEL
ncbi:hypothetical protein VKT23_016094 [Stygiomarasmius scandens]|uniref:Uncharacterized protein n=1 Tax=Marasmiellus scandens TaxID=2682957 RepID=A0ABR1IW16_9AGAR